MSTHRPVAVYRHLLRTFRSSFRGDHAAQAAARAETRTHFQNSAHVMDPKEVERLCDEGEDAAKFLQESIVQAKLNERGNYAMQVDDSHVNEQGSVIVQQPEEVVRDK